MMRFYTKIPVLNFVVAVSALTFQITVLYPWHQDLSKHLKQIECKIDQMLLSLDKKND